MQDVPLTIRYREKEMKGFAVPLIKSTGERPAVFDIIIDKAFLGSLHFNGKEWYMDTEQDRELVQLIGQYLTEWYDPSVVKPMIFMGSSTRAGKIG